MNPLSIIILSIIVIVVILIIIYLIKHKGEGCSMCNGDCQTCKKQYKKILVRYKQKK